MAEGPYGAAVVDGVAGAREAHVRQDADEGARTMRLLSEALSHDGHQRRLVADSPGGNRTPTRALAGRAATAVVERKPVD
jgi:hypothetical protein